MAEIRHRVGMKATPERVYNALATTDGLAAWWTDDVRGDAQQGGTLKFYFWGQPEPSAIMDVVETTPTERVQWSCVEGPDEWKGTALSFELSPGENETVLLFTHADWREPSEFMSHCSTKWGYHLLGMKAWAESGDPAPYPMDGKISTWG